jgi:hypothetical protein
MMAAGVLLVVLGFIGFAFSKNRNTPDKSRAARRKKASGK